MSARRFVGACALLGGAAVSVSAGASAAGRSVSRASTSDGPGTETVFLMKGGYGVTANLLANPARTSRVHVQAASPSTGVLQDSMLEAVGQEMLQATKTASALTQQLQAAVHQEVASEDSLRSFKQENAALKAQAAADVRKIQEGVQAEKEHANLQAQVARLSAEAKAAKDRAQKAEQELQAYKAKDKNLEQDLIVSNRAWHDATTSSRQVAPKSAPKPAALKTSKPAAVKPAFKADRVRVKSAEEDAEDEVEDEDAAEASDDASTQDTQIVDGGDADADAESDSDPNLDSDA